MMRPEEAAQLWLQKAEKEDDIVFRFASLWFAFNALYNQSHDGDRGERRVIKDFMYSRFSSEKAESILRACQGPIEFFGSRPIRDVLGRGTDTAEDAAKLKQNDNRPRQRLVALVMIVYRVRCNLFHGNKAYWRESDNRILHQAETVMKEILHISI